MRNKLTNHYALFSLLLDIGLTVLCLQLASKVRLFSWLPFEPLAAHSYSAWLVVSVVVIWFVVFTHNAVYDREVLSNVVKDLKSVSFAVFVSSMVLAGGLYLFERGLSRGFFITFSVLDVLFLVGWRVIIRLSLRHQASSSDKNKSGFDVRKRMLIVGAGDVGRQIAERISMDSDHKVKICGFIDDSPNSSKSEVAILGGTSELRTLSIELGVSDIIVALPMSAYSRVIEMVEELEDLPVLIRVIPDYFHLALYKAKTREYMGIPLVNLRAAAITESQRLYKRIFDIIVSAIVLIVFSPCMFLVALAIKIESKGPVFFFQDRIGENGITFKMYKFRSMVVNAEALQAEINVNNADGEIIHKTKSDPRITKVGKFIRRTSIDELPQLINVLVGDMSLVGPRPELPWLVKMYKPGQRTRFAVPQGITGWWQVTGRSDKPLHFNTDDDVYYLNNYSFWLDIYILLKTPYVVIKGCGAY